MIPKPIRDAMGLKPGSRVDFHFTDGKIVIDYAPVEWRIEMVDGFPVLRCSDEERLPVITDEMVQGARDAAYAEREARWL